MKYQKKACTTCTACVSVDSVMRMEKKNYPQIYLEESKYKSNTI